jgi:hypothetical protein
MLEDVSGNFTFEKLFSLIKEPELIALFLTFLLETIRRTFQPKAKVVYGVGHGFTFSIPQRPQTEPPTAIPNLLVTTRSIAVNNEGTATAEDVEFYFNYEPEHFQIWPAIQYTSESTEEGNFLIKIKTINPKEHFSIELIQSKVSTPELINVRAFKGRCKNVNMAPMQLYSKAFYNFVLVILILGIYQTILLALKLLSLL